MSWRRRFGNDWGRLGLTFECSGLPHWKNTQWGCLTELKYGKSLKDYKHYNSQYLVFGTNGIIGTTEQPLCNHASVIIGRKGAYRGVHYSPNPFYAIDTAFYLEALKKDEFDYEWAYYSLSTVDINSMDSGSAIPSTSREDFYALHVALPPLNEQKGMVEILSAFDNKIANNNAINQRLEQMAQAIFKSWFVDFEPTIKFTEAVQVLGGGTPKTSEPEFWNGNIPFFTPKDTLSSYVLTTEKSLTKLGLENCNSRLFPVNTVFVTARGTVGKLALAGCPMAMNQSCYALIGNKGYGQFYVYHLALDTVSRLIHKASGAVFDAIVTRDFDSEMIPNPPFELIHVFEETVTPIYQTILNNMKENMQLANLRDTLLPKLLSGEIEVPVNDKNSP